MTKKDWNPDLYLKFGKERIQPSIDLVSRIGFENPSSIIDIGCGPGNSTQILYERWPNSKIIGVDKSEAMINKARHDYPNQLWKIADAQNLISGEFDLVFSNATIQWIPNHAELFTRLKKNLSKNGILAIQIPLFFDMPIGKSIKRISKYKKWSHLTESVNDLFTIHSPLAYYDLLSEKFTSIELWETDYFHLMDSHHSILEMIRSTGLKPYLDQLESTADANEFETKVLEAITTDYKVQKNGKVLFPFKRLFIIATNHCE